MHICPGAFFYLQEEKFFIGGHIERKKDEIDSDQGVSTQKMP